LRVALVFYQETVTKVFRFKISNILGNLNELWSKEVLLWPVESTEFAFPPIDDRWSRGTGRQFVSNVPHHVMTNRSVVVDMCRLVESIELCQITQKQES
jgi:hypothetical protein